MRELGDREQGEREIGKFHRSCNESCITGQKIFSSAVKEKHSSMKEEEHVEKK